MSQEHDRATGILLEDSKGKVYLIRAAILQHACMPAEQTKVVHDAFKAGHGVIGKDSKLCKGSESGFTILGAVNADELKHGKIKDLPEDLHAVGAAEAAQVVGGRSEAAASTVSSPTTISVVPQTGAQKAVANTSSISSAVANVKNTTFQDPNISAEGTVMCPSW